jgi:hypothetical protein
MTLKIARLYDSACQDLAEHFLSDEPYTTAAVHEARVKELSEAVQFAVDEWFEDNPLPVMPQAGV